MGPVSFELFPPRSDAAALALGRTIDRLTEAKPAFFSVTFGAGGSHRAQSLTVLRYILEHTSVPAMAHFTSIGSTWEELDQRIAEFLDAGVRSFLALRGDPPNDASPTELGDLASAAELVSHLLHSPAVQSAGDRVDVAVAGFPNGHPRDEVPGQHFDALLAKQAAGATRVITQLFWRPSDYAAYVAEARSRGVTMDILPGVMPVTSRARLARLEELTGVEAPRELHRALSVDGPELAAAAGIEFAAGLVREVLRDAPGIHLYTFNQHETVLNTLALV
ncbi:MAG TPA: methylenetetrahydrofolate reductase [Microbacteriaceae bacterium]|nr:methylenetetrahydrofolate reductase [Microbacteriaceae bacterium]